MSDRPVPGIAHLYAQSIPHDSAYMLLQRKALESLYEALTNLHLGRSVKQHVTLQTADGEEYLLFIGIQENMEEVMTPYTEEPYSEISEASEQRCPFDVIGQDYYQKAHSENR